MFTATYSHETPPSLEYSIRYPVTGAPPSNGGAAHDRATCSWSMATAASSAGASGTVASVFANATGDGSLTPARLIALTR